MTIVSLPARPGREPVETVDGDGDYIFRFAVRRPAPEADTTLDEHYARSIRQLLRVVRLYENGRALIVDAFAFTNALDTVIPVGADLDAAPAGPVRGARSGGGEQP